MAKLLNIDCVQYLIDPEKEETESLARLYFCVHCMSIKSADVLQLEIDCHFCPQTLDGLPTGEAAAKKNKSSNSWKCPSCSNFLSTKATNLTVPSSDDSSKPVTKKSYYLICNFCRWTSRSVGIPDKDIGSGAWSEITNSQQTRIQHLFDYYKYLSSKEMAEVDEKKSHKKKGYFNLAMQLQQKYGPSRASQIRKQAAAAAASSLTPIRLRDSIKEVYITPSEPLGLDAVEKLPEDIYTKPVEFTQISSIDQRLDQSSYQPDTVSKFWPRKSTMYIKRSLRCKQCDHNVIKPEYNASSIKFKINLTAILHVPEIRISKLPELTPGKKSRVTLSIINPTANTVHLTLSHHEDKQKRCNAEVGLTSSVIVLGKYNEAAEYGEFQDDANEIGEDDSNVVAFRSLNKLGFYVDVTPNSDVTKDDDVWVTFSFKYDRYGTVPVAQMLKESESERKPEIIWLTQVVYINLGKAQV